MFRVALFPILFTAFAGAAQAVELRLMTEEYPPYNFRADDQIVGLGADQVFEAMRRADISYEVELTRWSRAIGLARRKPDTCVFSTFRTPDREEAFIWIGPLTEDRSLLIRAADSDITLERLEDAKTYSVGTQTGEFTVGILENAGFENVEQAPTMADALKKLLAGRNDLMAVPELYYQRLKAERVAVEPAYTLPPLQVALACHPQTDPARIAALRDAMAEIVADGTQAKITDRYK